VVGLPSQSLFHSINLPEQIDWSREQHKEQQEEVNETPTSSQNVPSDVELVDAEARMGNVIQKINNSQHVSTPTTLEEQGFDGVPHSKPLGQLCFACICVIERLSGYEGF